MSATMGQDGAESAPDGLVADSGESLPAETTGAQTGAETFPTTEEIEAAFDVRMPDWVNAQMVAMLDRPSTLERLFRGGTE